MFIEVFVIALRMRGPKYKLRKLTKPERTLLNVDTINGVTDDFSGSIIQTDEYVYYVKDDMVSIMKKLSLKKVETTDTLIP